MTRDEELRRAAEEAGSASRAGRPGEVRSWPERNPWTIWLWRGMVAALIVEVVVLAVLVRR